MENKVRNFMADNQLIKPDNHIILGISGGPDSIALLFVMQKIKDEYNLTLSVAHVNHGLRVEAVEEEALVRRLCHNFNIPFYSHSADVASLAKKAKKSIEEMGREVRYSFFYQLLHSLNADLIATAHHLDDNAETVLLNILRGTGIKGLRGIMPYSKGIIRPLLLVSKLEIEAYLKAEGIPYFIDKSNFDPVYLRNKLRQELIPLLKSEYNPNIVESLNQLAIIAREEDEELENQALMLYNEALIKSTADTVVLSIPFLTRLSTALQKRVILHTLKTFRGELGWEAIDVSLILDLMSKDGSRKMIHLKKQLNVAKIYDELVFSIKEREIINFDYLLNIPSTVSLPTGKKYLFKVVSPEQLVTNDCVAFIDYDKCKLPLHLRSRKAGDVFYPYGLKGSKKLKSYFIDIKIPHYKRNMIPLLTSQDDDIYVVLGYRISNLVKVDDKSSRILIIKELS